MGEHADIICEKKKTSLILKLQGEIDHHLVEEIKDEIDGRFESMKAKNIIFDFSGVTFMDSAGIGLIIGRIKNVSRTNGQAAIVNAGSSVRRILDISGIFKIVKAYGTLAEALKSID